MVEGNKYENAVFIISLMIDVPSHGFFCFLNYFYLIIHSLHANYSFPNSTFQRFDFNSYFTEKQVASEDLPVCWNILN